MPENQGKKLREYIRMNEINVDKDVLPKVADAMSKATFYKQYDQETIKPEYISALLKAGIDFLGQVPTTRLKQGLQFPQKESGLAEKVKVLEEQVRQLQTSLLDLYSRLPKQS